MSNKITNVQHDSKSMNLANTTLNEAVFRPMLFNTPMVQALINGTKTQTCRIFKPSKGSILRTFAVPFS